MLADVLHKVAAMEFEEKEPGAYYPRPSLAGPERCLRQMVYWARGEDRKPLPGRAVVVFDDSSWHEELTADLIRKSAFHVHSQQLPVFLANALPWMPENERWKCHVCGASIYYRDLHGHIDFIVTDILGVDRLVEHKALSHFGFEELLRGELPMDYLTQKAIYLRGVKLLNPDLNEGILLVKNKNQSGFLEFRSRYDWDTDTLVVLERVHHTGAREDINLKIPNIVGDALKRFEEVDRYRVAGTLPQRQYEIDHWRCQYCGYHETCWDGWIEEHAALATDVALEQEIVDLVRYERECHMHETEMRKEKEALREKIKALLKAANIRSGRAGDYMVDWTVTKRKKLDMDLLPPEAVAQATIEVPAERLVIRKAKPKQKEKAA